MKKNKLVLSHCPNFYKIINFEFLEDDQITARLIEIYKNFIFSSDVNDHELKVMEKFDFILNKYIDDYYFRKELQRSLLALRIGPGENMIKCIINKLMDLFESYESGYTRNIYFARWI